MGKGKRNDISIHTELDSTGQTCLVDSSTWLGNSRKIRAAHICSLQLQSTLYLTGGSKRKCTEF